MTSTLILIAVGFMKGSFNLFPIRTFVFSTTEHLNQKNSFRFIIYLMIGCGIPFLMTLSIILIDIFKVGTLLPEVGAFQCFLSAKAAKYYFHLPIFLLLCFNSLVFLITVFSLWRGYKKSEFVSSNRLSLLSAQVNCQKIRWKLS